MVELSPIERAVLWIGAYEFQHCPDVPWRVVINECIELAKAFGGTDGHKYVNGVLHRWANSCARTKWPHRLPAARQPSRRLSGARPCGSASAPSGSNPSM